MNRSTRAVGLLSLALSPLGAALLSACGGGQTQLARSVNESEDFDAPREAERAPSGPRQALGEIANTRWRWVEASCTEGPLNLSERGFQDEMQILQETTGYALVHDQAFTAENCKRTIVQMATPGAGGPEDDWQMSEEQRIALPATPACEGIPERPRPGEVRRVGNRLEVLVQRSDWCNGYEVRMAYEPVANAPLRDEQVISRYAISFNRRNASAIGSLFADAGSLVEPFTTNEDGSATRHDGRDAVVAWFTESFQNLPWVALRLTGVSPGSAPGHFNVTWEYMDPRLETPLTGLSKFTLAAGEIYEAEMELTGASAAAAAQPAVRTPTQEATPAPGTPNEQPAAPARARRGRRAAQH